VKRLASWLKSNELLDLFWKQPDHIALVLEIYRQSIAMPTIYADTIQSSLDLYFNMLFVKFFFFFFFHKSLLNIFRKTSLQSWHQRRLTINWYAERERDIALFSNIEKFFLKKVSNVFSAPTAPKMLDKHKTLCIDVITKIEKLIKQKNTVEKEVL